MDMYCYDGTWDGLLTSIQQAWVKQLIPRDIVRSSCYEENLFAQRIEIATDVSVAKKMKAWIRNTLSLESPRYSWYTFLSDVHGCEYALFEYLSFGREQGKKLDFYLADERVRRVHQLSHRVSFEAGRMLGFVRFEELKDNLYYAKIEPEHNVLPIIGRHFSARLGTQAWMIHDVKRNTALLYDPRTRQHVIRPVHIEYEPSRSDEELLAQRVWKEYFTHIAIKERTNPRLQRQYMPRRYWKHMTEVKEQ